MSCAVYLSCEWRRPARAAAKSNNQKGSRKIKQYQNPTNTTNPSNSFSVIKTIKTLPLALRGAGGERQRARYARPAMRGALRNARGRAMYSPGGRYLWSDPTYETQRITELTAAAVLGSYCASHTQRHSPSGVVSLSQPAECEHLSTITNPRAGPASLSAPRRRVSHAVAGRDLLPTPSLGRAYSGSSRSASFQG